LEKVVRKDLPNWSRFGKRRVGSEVNKGLLHMDGTGRDINNKGGKGGGENLQKISLWGGVLATCEINQTFNLPRETLGQSFLNLGKAQNSS